MHNLYKLFRHFFFLAFLKNEALSFVEKNNFHCPGYILGVCVYTICGFINSLRMILLLTKYHKLGELEQQKPI